MLSKDKIERINFLVRKAKSEGLSQLEKKEQDKLRKEYLENFRKDFKEKLDSIELV